MPHNEGMQYSISLLLLICIQPTRSTEQVPTGPVKLTWRRATPAPEVMYEAAVVHGNTAYFSQDYNVYSYTLFQDKWTKLRPCDYEDFSMAVVNNILTIGGTFDGTDTNTLLCFSSKMNSPTNAHTPNIFSYCHHTHPPDRSWRII